MSTMNSALSIDKHLIGPDESICIVCNKTIISKDKSFLVIDIYSNTPEQVHYAWYSYSLDIANSPPTEALVGRINLNNEIHIELNENFAKQCGFKGRDSWTSNNVIPLGSIELRVVLRSKVDNKIQHIRTCTVLSSKQKQDLKPFAVYPKEQKVFRQIVPSRISKILLVSGSLQARDAMTEHCLRLSQQLSLTGHKVTHAVSSWNWTMALDAIPLSAIPEIKTYSSILIDYGSFIPSIEEIVESISEETKLYIYFHGITPVQELILFDLDAAFACKKGADQLKRVIGICTHRSINITWIVNSVSTGEQLRALVDERTIELIENSDLNPECTSPTHAPVQYTIIPPLYSYIPAPEYTNSKSVYTGMHEPKLRFMILGRLTTHKRVEDALALLSTLQAMEIAIHADIVFSSYSEDYRRYIEQIANTNFAPNSINFYHSLPAEQLDELWRQANFCLHPSAHEGYGLVIRESIVRGVPVISRLTASIIDEGLESVILSEFNIQDLPLLSEYILDIVQSQSIQDQIQGKLVRDSQKIVESFESSRQRILDLLAK